MKNQSLPSEEELYNQMCSTGVVPIVTISDVSHAQPLADALVAGGITTVEITLRTAAAFDAIEAISGRTDIAVGVGTVTSKEQVDEAIARGAKFIVSPGISASVVERSLERGIWPIPGIATASELQIALSFGLRQVKLFPAEVLGGIPLLDALSGPFPDTQFMPSGGINSGNINAYLTHPSVFAVGCSWIATPQMLTNGFFDAIRLAAAVSVEATNA